MGVVLSGIGRIDAVKLHELSCANPGWTFEIDDAGALLLSPTHTSGGAKSGEAFLQLGLWAKGRPGSKAFDSSTGFTLPSGAIRSPDASWLSVESISSLSEAQLDGYWQVCPDIAVEVASRSDVWDDVVEKVRGYARWGAHYAVAIDPMTRATVEIGEPPAGLAFDFDAIIDA